ncbi:hypothetical protein KKG46_04595 [Patescibacteria group bacterium]|nr:hypothetical protein [Patescibacteria group bacterium]
MLKKKSFVPNDKPVYREVIPQAFKFAWKHPQYWLFGFIASFLFTGGSADIFFKFWNSLQAHSGSYFGYSFQILLTTAKQSLTNGVTWLMFFQALVALLIFLVIFIAIVAFSAICQGALVHVIGAWKLDKKHFVRQALSVGSKAIVPVIALNLIMIFFVWISRFAVSWPFALALSKENLIYYIIYIIAFVIFFTVTLFLGVIQLYSLNAIILQGATLRSALDIAWKLVKKHWLITIETAVLQAFLVAIIGFVVAIIFMILAIPAYLLYILSFINSSVSLFETSVGIFFALIIITVTITTGFLANFQYAIWALMFKKFGEGGAVPKIHRIIKSILKKS